MMPKHLITTFFLLFLVIFFAAPLKAQNPREKEDTFFLAKKKGLLGKLGKSISVDPPGAPPVKTANPYLVYTGKTIRSIKLVPLGFERNIYDTNEVKNNLGLRIANALHKNTRSKVLMHNLFFKEGDKIQPYLVADNERFLRDLAYIQDARILVENIGESTDSVDITVITKDVFSIGLKVDMNSLNKVGVEILEQNVGGKGSQISISTLYDKDSKQKIGYGAEFLKRNIKGSFIDWSLGFQTFRGAFNSGRNEELSLYTHFEKPLVTAYIPWIGSLDISYNQTRNLYVADSLYQSDYKYTNLSTDAWFGYNFGSKKLLYKNAPTRLRKFIAVRSFSQYFFRQPNKKDVAYDRYADSRGILAAISVFKQDFYRTNFIYGFGRNEDVPEGFTASVVGGWTNRRERSRPYYGLETQFSFFAKKGFYSTYTLKFGGYTYKKKWEDIDILLNIDHFTRLKKINTNWFCRNFFNGGFTRQVAVNPLIHRALILSSDFGLPYFENGNISADFRGTVKAESVFYNMKKHLGFRFAPFVFGGLSLLTPTNEAFNKSDLYSAFGAGVRTRNENLVFGTIELKGYVFPRPVGGMKGWKVEVTTNLLFKYNSSFIRRPDFVVPN